MSKRVYLKRGKFKYPARDVVLTIRARVRIEVEAPEIRAYVQNALGSWGGGGDPEGPLYDGLIVRTVKVKEEG
jgi:hypothetical protein